MARRSILGEAFYRLGSRGYDFIHRRGMFAGGDPRPELVHLVGSGRLPAGRAIDLGCGTGTDSIFLSSQGFDVIGVDISPVAIEEARRAAAAAGSDAQFVEADLLDLPGEIQGPFDVLYDGGTLDDFPPRLRPKVAEAITEISAPGSVLAMWCFYAADRDLPRLSFKGASRWGAPAIEPGEEVRLFGDDWSIEHLDLESAAPGTACFVMTRN